MENVTLNAASSLKYLHKTYCLTLKFKIMKVYIVKNYQFFKSDNVEYQCANCGDTGLVFTSRKRAEKYFYKRAEELGISQTEIRLFPYLNFEYHYYNRNVMTLQEVECI